MTKSNLGENLLREWNEDPYPRDLWDALASLGSNPQAGLEMLLDLAAEGSALSMVHLGLIYWRGKHGVEKNLQLAEAWLRRSVVAGSVEGAFGLAKYLQASGRFDEAVKEYERLVDLGYSPAGFILGYQYYKGEIAEHDLDKSLFYFRMSERCGHLYAKQWVSSILMGENLGFLSWMHGLAKRISLFIPLAVTMIKYPESDRLRS